LRPPSAEQLAATVAERLRRIVGRKERALQRLADLSGLDADQLQRIESGAEAPAIGHLWRIANALGVPFGSLVAAKERDGVLVMRKSEAQTIRSADGAFLSRPLFPYDCRRPVEFYQIVIGPSHIQRAEAHAAGAKENLVVAKGLIEVVVGREPPVQLDEGDAIDFLADVPHSYRNLGTSSAVLYLVMTYEASAEGARG
jgi:transcriptional regulator with XRE-family HTH domain